MNEHKMFAHNSFFASLGSAFRGVRSVAGVTANFRRELFIFATVLLLALILRLPALELSLIISVSGAVLAFEAVNSALELLGDALHPHHHPLIRHAKDIAAGAVVIMSLAAALVGMLLFGPRIYMLLVG